MKDLRVQRHPFGYLEAVDKPEPSSLRAYYSKCYYQEGHGNYRDSYPPAERRYIEEKLCQRAGRISEIRGDRPGRLLDVGCGEGFALGYYRKLGWIVEGLDYSSAGLAAMNPNCLDILETGDVMLLLESRIRASRKYDVILLNNVLEHLADPPDLLHKLQGLVSNDGVVVITVPNDFSDYQQYLLEAEHVDEPFWVALPDHLAYFDRESLLSLARATGWVCHDTLADFPIDWFLLHPGSNYIRQRSLGPAAHQARIELENLLSEQPIVKVNAFFSAMAKVGLGRAITAFLTPVRSR